MLTQALLLLFIPALVSANCREMLDTCRNNYVFAVNQGDTLKMACCAVTGVLECLEHRASGHCQAVEQDRTSYNILKGQAENIEKQCDTKRTADGSMPPECDGIVIVGRALWKTKVMIVIGSVVATLLIVTLVVVGIWCALKKKKAGN